MMPLNEADTIAYRLAALGTLDVEPGLGAFFKRDFLVRSRFRAAIFEGDFRDADGAVSAICRERSITTVRCLSLDDATNVPAYRLVPTHEDLKTVRQLYHTPSYVVQDESSRFVIVSDSDYYWGFAASVSIVEAVVARNSHLQQTRADIHSFLDSADAHDRRIGAMLSNFHDVRDSVATTAA